MSDRCAICDHWRDEHYRRPELGQGCHRPDCNCKGFVAALAPSEGGPLSPGGEA